MTEPTGTESSGDDRQVAGLVQNGHGAVLAPTGRVAGRVERALAVVVAAAGIAGFVALAIPRGWVNDDALITSRYAAHVAAGHGYVWNVVDSRPVEGSTSIAWTLLQALAIRAGFDPIWVAHLMGLASGAAIVATAWLAAWRILGVGPLPALATIAFLGAQRQLVAWSVSGMETSAGALVVLAATLQLLREAKRAGERSAGIEGSGDKNIPVSGLWSGLLFLLGSTVRPETPLLHFAAGIGILAVQRSRRALALVAVSGLVHVVGLAALTTWRLVTFDQPLPNPFYVKVGALQLGRGLRFLGAFLVQNHAVLWGGAIFLALPSMWRRSRLPLAALGAPVLAWCVWLAFVGGDVWEFRMLVPVLPLLALLFALSITALAGAARGILARDTSAGGLPARSTLARRSPAIATAVAVLWIVAVAVSQLRILHGSFAKFGDSFSVEELARGSTYMSLEAAILAPYLGPGDRICTGWSGAIPFYTGAWHFDPWGLNDPTVARRPLEAGRVLYHQKHASWDDVVANRVVICDLFNHFLFPRPFDAANQRRVVPWVEPGVPVYTVRLPEGQYWIFTSTRSREEVEAWLGERGLAPESVVPLPGGWPWLGG